MSDDYTGAHVPVYSSFAHGSRSCIPHCRGDSETFRNVTLYGPTNFVEIRGSPKGELNGTEYWSINDPTFVIPGGDCSTTHTAKDDDYTYMCSWDDVKTDAEFKARLNLLRTGVASGSGWVLSPGQKSEAPVVALYEATHPKWPNALLAIQGVHESGLYLLNFAIYSKHPSNTAARQGPTIKEGGMQEWVREDLKEYIKASDSNFEAYKSGSPRTVDGHLVWRSSSQPLLADYCQVVGLKANAFVCQLSHFGTQMEAHKAYSDLIGYVAKADAVWDWSSKPYPGEVESVKALSIVLGLEGEIWVHYDRSKSEWNLYYQLTRISPPVF